MNQADISPYKGSAQITREQFLFYETRTTARLLTEGLGEQEVITRIADENLFQYPTEKSVKLIARACIERCKSLDDNDLTRAVATESTDTAKQICLYAMMKQYTLVWDFMVSVIGEKYRTRDLSFGKREINVFFLRLREQDDYVAGWSEATLQKLRQVFTRVLVENEYLESLKADRLNPIWLNPLLENVMKGRGETKALAAFNCFG